MHHIHIASIKGAHTHGSQSSFMQPLFTASLSCIILSCAWFNFVGFFFLLPPYNGFQEYKNP